MSCFPFCGSHNQSGLKDKAADEMAWWVQKWAFSNIGSQETHRPGAQEERPSRAESLRGFLASSNFCWSFSPQWHQGYLLQGKRSWKKTCQGPVAQRTPARPCTVPVEVQGYELSPHWKGRITWQVRTWILETDCLALNLGYVVWLWASKFSSLFSSFFTHQVRITILSTSKAYEGIEWINILRAFRTVLGI